MLLHLYSSLLVVKGTSPKKGKTVTFKTLSLKWRACPDYYYFCCVTF
nr:MAG TPA: hypothetical protein [Caudoviricetes sp.]